LNFYLRFKYIDEGAPQKAGVIAITIFYQTLV